MAHVDPHAPRFGQSITTVLLLTGIALQVPAFVYAVALIQNLAVWSRWRLNLYGMAWRHLVVPRFVTPADPEPAAPHRFATLMGAVLSGIGSLALLAGYPMVGYAFAAAVALAAGIAAVTDICIGCRMYRGVSLFRRLSIL